MKPTFNNKPKRREPMTANDVAYNKKMTRDVQMEWVEACIESSKLTEWERNFVGSLHEQLSAWGDRKEGVLSERQVEVLERIYNEKV